MCLSPIVIPNKSRRFTRGLSRPMLTVACGHCAECASRQQDDWFVRAIYETRRVESKGGAVWVPILTYRNEDLPRWKDPEFNMDIPCFDPTHIKRFRDRLRIYFTRHADEYRMTYGIDLPIPRKENTIRYIICSEYGDRFGRSHCHCLLYVPFFVKAAFMKEAIEFAWCYGMVRYSKHGMMARGMRAARYSMKYVSKDMCWSNRYGTDKYEEELKNRMYKAYRNKDIDSGDMYRERLKAFRRVKPRHYQSMGFGIDGVNYFKNDDGTWNVERCVSGKLDGSRLGVPPMKSGEVFQYDMPMYYVRKIFYNVDDWNLYKMTEFGKEIFALRFDLALKRQADKYDVYLNKSDLIQHLSFVEDINPEDVYNEVHRLMDGRSASSLALFDIVYRDIEGVSDDDRDIESGSSCSNEAIIHWLNDGMSDDECFSWLYEVSLDFMLAQKSLDRIPDPERSYQVSRSVVAKPSFNDLPCFRNYKAVLNIISDCEKAVGAVVQKARETQREREHSLKGFSEDPYVLSNIFIGEI